MRDTVFFWVRTNAARAALVLVACLAIGVSVLRAADEPSFSDEALEYFEREVRPVLAKRCYECHGGEISEPKGGLRLDSRKSTVAGGDTGPAIVPGDAASSLLIDAVNYGDIYEMPPKTKLPAREIEVLTKWVEMGAPWPRETRVAVTEVKSFDLEGRKASHWCWQPIQLVEPPDIVAADWPQQEFDGFVLAALEAKGLHPARRADKPTLLRRAFFDLVGLPPTREEFQAFLADESPDAFAAVVDRLLDSPHFGERWARHWLDLVRYAESYGHEFDYPVPAAYRYRDYVIRALNGDVPYDQFVVEHVAGDLVGAPRLHPEAGYNESVIGTGFWWLGEATHAPVDVRDDEARRIDNQIDVMCKTFLGLTVACARCHDHKFDAISTKDYYSLAGFLQSSRRQEAFITDRSVTRTTVDRLGQLQDEGSRVLVQALADSGMTASRFAGHMASAWESGLGDGSHEQDEGAGKWSAALSDDRLREAVHPLHSWWLLQARGSVSASDVRSVLSDLDAAAGRAERANADLPVIADFSNRDGYSDWFLTGTAFGDRPTEAAEWDHSSNAVQLRSPGWADSGRLSKRAHGVLRSPTFELTHPNIFYRVSGHGARVRLILDGYFMDVYNALLFKGFYLDLDTKGDAVWQAQGQDIQRYVGQRGYLEIIDHGDESIAISEIRLSDGKRPVVPPSRLARQVLRDGAVDSPADLARGYGAAWEQALVDLRRGRADGEQTELINWALRHDLVVGPREQLDRLRSRIDTLAESLAAPDRALAMADGSSENEHVFIRGNYRTLGPEAPRRFLQALDGSNQSATMGSGRLALAEKLVDPANPLVSRVIVNRIWHHLFGRGIVASVDNFGVLGQEPTHPELLDFLAARFVRDGWSLKSLIRTLMLSSTYQMTSDADPHAHSVDPENLLLHSMRVRRLQGEAIRDSILALSQQLDPTMYGPSVPVHVTDFMQGRGRPKKSGPLDGSGRRSVYLQVRRNFLSPFMLAFDAPIPFNTIGRRNTSNVPAQALILMNDPFVVDQAKRWSVTLPLERQTSEEIIERMYLSAFTRYPTKNEVMESLAFLKDQSAELQFDGATGGYDRQAWADLAHVLWNVKEFVYLR